MNDRLEAEDEEDVREERLIDDVDPLPIERTGDDRPARSLWRYLWRMSGKHQICAGLLAVFVAVLDLIPIELQRRIVDDALTDDSYDLLLLYGAIYLGVVALHQVMKFALRMYQGWISESAILYSRRHLMSLYGRRIKRGEPDSGAAVAILTNEIDKLGGFVGEGVVQAASNVAMLMGATAYMLAVEPQIALLGLALMAPQVMLTPILQRKLNLLVEKRVGHMRSLSEIVSDDARAADGESHEVTPRLYANRMRFFFVKFGMKALLNLLNALAPLTVLIYGGYLVIEGHTTVGVIVAFLSGFQRVSAPLRALIAFYRAAAQASIQHEMIADWMEQEKDNEAERPSPRGDVKA